MTLPIVKQIGGGHVGNPWSQVDDSCPSEKMGTTKAVMIEGERERGRGGKGDSDGGEKKGVCGVREEAPFGRSTATEGSECVWKGARVRCPQEERGKIHQG